MWSDDDVTELPVERVELRRDVDRNRYSVVLYPPARTDFVVLEVTEVVGLELRSWATRKGHP